MDIYSFDFIITIFINLIVTILGYCGIPILLRITKGKLEYNKGHKIILINCVVAWLIFSIIKIEQGINTTSGAVILYYFVNKAILLKPKNDIKKNKGIEVRSDLNNKEDFKLQESNEQLISNNKDIENKKSSKKEKIVSNNLELKERKLKIGLIVSGIVIIILGIICVFLCCYSHKNIKELEEERSSLRNRIYRLSEENSDYFRENIKLKVKADFLDNNIVFVLDGYGNYYYTYDQVQQVTQGTSYSYWIYTENGAKSKGYRAWK